MSGIGLRPLEFKVIVKPDVIEEKTTGGIIIPEQVKEQKQNAQNSGTIMEVSEHAFSYDDWVSDKPKPGDRVYYARYAGATVEGGDGNEYRIINDKDITAIIC